MQGQHHYLCNSKAKILAQKWPVTACSVKVSTCDQQMKKDHMTQHGGKKEVDAKYRIEKCKSFIYKFLCCLDQGRISKSFGLWEWPKSDLMWRSFTLSPNTRAGWKTIRFRLQDYVYTAGKSGSTLIFLVGQVISISICGTESDKGWISQNQETGNTVERRMDKGGDCFWVGRVCVFVSILLRQVVQVIAAKD